MSIKHSLTTLFALLLLLMPVSAQAPGGAGMKFDSEVEVHANGDASLHLVMKLSPAKYSKLKARVTNPFNFLRDFTSNRADYEVAKGAQCRYDDATTSFVMDITELGSVRNLGGGYWEMPIEQGPEFVMKGQGEHGRTAVHFYEARQQDDGSILQGKQVYRLPKGATDVAWDAGSRIVTYKLEAPKGEGPGRLKIDVKVKSRLMTCVYKTYGLGQTSGDADEISAQWVAKSVIRNVGKNTITDLRVRYRVAGYSEWSPWQKFAEVVPAQTAVSVYYPVLERRMAEIRTNTPANVLVEWTYVDGKGKEREDSDGKRVTLLGVNEFVFSNLLRGANSGSWHDNFNNAPLLAAWVSRNDPVVKQFASMANRIAGGVGASGSVDDAIKALNGCYELMLRNDFTYQHPPALTDNSVSFEPARVQNVKFPRDVIRDRSGTCIDLAILYASMANAIGLEAYLCVVPGHVFPVIKMPNGVYAGVETTGVGGGLRGKAYPFDAMLKVGMKKLANARKSGLLYLVDLQKLWTRGVSNPELPALPADILQKWNLVESRATATPQIAANVAPTPAPARRPAPQQRRKAPALEGMWGGKVTETLDNGQRVTYAIGVQIKSAGGGHYAVALAATANIPTPNGAVEVILAEGFTATIKNGVLVGKGVKKTATNGATGVTENVGPLDTIRITRNGNGLVARVGNDEEGYDDISLIFIQK